MTKWILIVLLAIIAFAFILYATVKTKSTSLNKYAPFNEWIGKEVSLNTETVLFKEKLRMNGNANYPYPLLDRSHPGWEYVEQRKTMPTPELVEILTFPIGTKIKIEKAIQYTNGVSGSSYPTVLGTIFFEGKSYKISYQWGENEIGKWLGKEEKSWKFHQAPWQSTPYGGYYALPTANFW